MLSKSDKALLLILFISTLICVADSWSMEPIGHKVASGTSGGVFMFLWLRGVWQDERRKWREARDAD